MLKKRYKIFLAVFCLIIVCAAWLSTKISYSYDTQPLSDKDFSISRESTCLMDRIPLWFTFESGDAVLHMADGIEESVNTVSFLYPDDTRGTENVESFQYTDEMMGDLLVCAESMEIDLDGDGTKENVLASAKSQTLVSQGYDLYGYNNHTFGDETIPVEIVYAGSTFLTTDITVLVFGVPYTGTVRLQSVAGLDRTIDITDGLITDCTIHDLRKGLSVLISDEENDRILAGSYIVEDYSMFTAQYFSGLCNLYLLLGIIIAGGIAISAVRYWVRRHLSRRREMAC